jgi:hypothetical protein
MLDTPCGDCKGSARARGLSKNRSVCDAVVRVVGVTVAALACLLVSISSASAISGPQSLTFGDYETGAEISTQSQGQGIVFRSEYGFYPEVRWDYSASTNPVLSGTFGFGSPISAEFVQPGTMTPVTVEKLAMDVGYIDEPGSTELTVERTSGGTFSLLTNEYGFNHLYFGGNNISGFTLHGDDEDPEGFELDNREFTIPPPAALLERRLQRHSSPARGQLVDDRHVEDDDHSAPADDDDGQCSFRNSAVLLSAEVMLAKGPLPSGQEMWLPPY